MPNPNDTEYQQELETGAAEKDQAAADEEAAGRPRTAAQRADAAGTDWERLGTARLRDAEKLLRQALGHRAKARLKDAIDALLAAAESFARAARNHRAVGQAAEADAADASSRRCRQTAGALLERRGHLLFEQGELDESRVAFHSAADAFAQAGDPEGFERAKQQAERVYFIQFEPPRRCLPDLNRVHESRLGHGAGFTRQAAETAAREAAETAVRRFIRAVERTSHLCPRECQEPEVTLDGPLQTVLAKGPDWEPREHVFRLWRLSFSFWTASAVCNCRLIIRCRPA